MDIQTPAHLDARGFIERFEREEFPRDFVLLAARGFLPLAQDDLVTILIFLTAAEDEEIAAASHAALADVPVRSLLAFARNPELGPDQLDRLARSSDEPSVIESILRNRSTADETIRVLATHVTGHLQDVIVINHERLLRAPDILEALSSNPELTPDVRRRIGEIEQEFFQKKRIEDVKIEEGWGEVEYELTPEEQEQFADLLAAAESAGDDGANTLRDAAPTEADLDSEPIWNRIQRMNISERVRCALKGGRTARGILVKDRNKLVCAAAIRSPRITESEVETFAGLRNVEDEVLRIIGSRRDWMQKYALMMPLVKNPKAPIGVVLPLINRLTLKDLKTLSSDKNVSEAVRQTARKLYNTRKKT